MKSYLLIAIALFLSILVGTSCKTQEVSFEEYDGNIISIGSSGGFTGKTTKYFILEDGRLYQQNDNLQGVTELPSLDPEVTAQQFALYYDLGFDKMEINEIGNMSYFIIMNERTDQSKVLRWSGQTMMPDQTLELYYNNLSALIKKNNKAVK